MDYDCIHFINYDLCSNSANSANGASKNTILSDIQSINQKFTIVDTRIDIQNQPQSQPNCQFTINPVDLEAYYFTIPLSVLREYLQLGKKKMEVIRQMNLDIPRSDMYCNGEYVQSTSAFIHYLEWKTEQCGSWMDFMEIGTLCTQIVFALPVTYIQHNIPENYYICELERSLNKKHSIHLDIQTNTTNNCLEWSILVKKQLRICTLDKNMDPFTIYNFTIIITIKEDTFHIEIKIL